MVFISYLYGIYMVFSTYPERRESQSTTPEKREFDDLLLLDELCEELALAC